MERILLSHGEGGRLTRELIEEYIYPLFKNRFLKSLSDSAVLNVKGKIAFTIDSYIVSPYFFNGGDIGKLAISGSVNDLAVSGAKPLAIAFALIVEEGFDMASLREILQSASKTAKIARVKIVAGDTKVLPKERGDQIYIITAGLGVIKDKINFSDKKVKVKDKIIVSGDLGRHGAAIAAHRHNLKSSKLLSDCMPINRIVESLIKKNIIPKVLHDPTRGGLGTLLNEVARKSNCNIEIYEEKIPFKDEVKGICEILGLDPIYLPSEGRFVGFFKEEDAEKALRIIKRFKGCEEASIIGDVVKKRSEFYRVILKTSFGSFRPIDELSYIQLPRIC